MRRLTRRRTATAGGGEPNADPGASDAHLSAGPESPPSLLADPAQVRPAGPPSPAAPDDVPSGDEAARTAVVRGQFDDQERVGTPLEPRYEPTPERLAHRDLPAGVDPAELEHSLPPSASRARVRRRAAFLSAARELLLRDLGGFVLEVHRTAGVETDAHRRLRDGKTARLMAVEAELRTLDERLGVPRAVTVIREPGVGGECPRCAELHASDANWCAHCGLPLSHRARKAAAGAEGDIPAPIEPIDAAAAAAARRDPPDSRLGAAPDSHATIPGEPANAPPEPGATIPGEPANAPPEPGATIPGEPAGAPTSTTPDQAAGAGDAAGNGAAGSRREGDARVPARGEPVDAPTRELPASDGERIAERRS